MYSEETKENSFTFTTVPIQVYLVSSYIYSSDPEELPSANDEDTAKVYPIKLRVYNQLVISLDELMARLKEATGMEFTGFQILHKTYGPYILAGTFPFTDGLKYLNIASVYDPIFIKVRVADKIKTEEVKRGLRRGNERKIADVIKALFIWRTLFMIGQIDAENKLRKYNRQEAAKLVNIPKKTLEDYLLQIRMALNNGFDFNMYSNTRFGVIRDFNRQRAIKAA